VILLLLKAHSKCGELETPTIRPELLADLPSYTECPAFDYDGNLFVSEERIGQVIKIIPAGEKSGSVPVTVKR